MFEGGKGAARENLIHQQELLLMATETFWSPTLVNGRIEKFSPNGTFLSAYGN